MAEPSGGKFFSSRLLYFLALISVFWFSPNLSALSSLTSSADQFSSELYAHSHMKPQTLPKPQPAEAEQKESIRLDVTGAWLSCSEDDCSHHHHGCNLEIGYRLSSAVHSKLDLGAHVVCRARLDYMTSHGYHLQSERCSSPADHTLHHRDQVDSTIVVEFQFSPYEQVIDAQVGAIQCSIEDVDILHKNTTGSTADLPLPSP